MYCLETKNLTHKFSADETVLNAINVQIPQGSIYGFLGPNGAGKTTTLRLILGLLRKQEGSIEIFNKKLETARVEILGKTGSLIESPSLYGHLTATENLRILQKVYRCPAVRINEVLEIVGLAHTGKKKAGKFSLGMKQRLSIAMALLPSPELLILDEPTNGLDPNGILEIRELLKKLNSEQKITIVISSHLLSEVEKLVTHLGIINKGSVLFQGTLSDLQSQQDQSSFIRFTTDNADKTLAIIESYTLKAIRENEHVLIPVTEKEVIAKINAQLVSNNIQVYQISVVKNDLEAIFMDLTKKN
jgi:lantibiotic transport system ATP-binding protein